MLLSGPLHEDDRTAVGREAQPFHPYLRCLCRQVLQAWRTVKAAGALLGHLWDAAQPIINQAAERGLKGPEANPIRHIGIDEKSFWKGRDYITALTAIDGARFLHVAPEEIQAAEDAVLQPLSVEQRQAVQGVAADMLPAYANAVANQIRNAKLVHEQFHVAKHFGDAVD